MHRGQKKAVNTWIPDVNNVYMKPGADNKGVHLSY